ncbi:MAG: hypothetical protein K2K97_10360 [Muribaculaceae bacterium]|nr:hypothetical protein [Muribaculaceae bacterium]
MNRIRISLIAAIALVATLAVKAQESYLRFYANPDEIKVANGMAELNFWYDTDITTLNPIDFDLYLPTGFTLEKDEDDDYVVDVNTTAAKNHSFTIGDHTDATDPYYTFVGASIQRKNLKAGNNKLFTVNIVAPSDFVAAKYPSGVTCSVKKITVAGDTEPISEYHPEDFSFTILPHDLSTGVDEIGVDSKEEVIYNLQGIRVERPLTPGLYIINGEKTMVK